jgi:hypothetical protein
MKKNYLGLNCSCGIIALTVVIVFVMSACDPEQQAVDNSKYYLDAPTGIVATLLSDDSIHLTWNAVSGASYYTITYRTNLDSADTRRSVGTSYITEYDRASWSWWWSYNKTDVSTLYFYIKTHPSKSGYIESGWSNPVSVNVK